MCVCVCVHTCLCAIVPIHSVSHSFLILHQWEAAVILFLCSSPLCVHALHNSVYTYIYIYISAHTRLQRVLSFLPTVVCCLFGVSSSVVLPVWSPTTRLISSQHWSHFVCLTASNPAHTRSLSHTDTHTDTHTNLRHEIWIEKIWFLLFPSWLHGVNTTGGTEGVRVNVCILLPLLIDGCMQQNPSVINWISSVLCVNWKGKRGLRINN